MDFTEKRRRGTRGSIVSGALVDERDKTLPQPTVRYETAGKRWHGDDQPHEAEVNWSAMGAQPLAVARDYAKQILAACDAAEVGPRPFEPHDEVTADNIPEGQIGIVRNVSGARVRIEFGVPGEPDTWRERTYWTDKDAHNLRRTRA